MRFIQILPWLQFLAVVLFINLNFERFANICTLFLNLQVEIRAHPPGSLYAKPFTNKPTNTTVIFLCACLTKLHLNIKIYIKSINLIVDDSNFLETKETF